MNSIYFGDHYDKLECIKNKYDPTSLFVVASGVGSDKWDEQLYGTILDQIICVRTSLSICE